MNTAEFNLIFDQTIERCRQTLCNKAIEYAENDDRLHNFHVAAGLQGNTPIEALGGMMVKYTVSVFDMIRNEGKGASYVQELWQEKIKDSINYLILLQAMVSEPSQTRKDAPASAEPIQGGIISLPADNPCISTSQPSCAKCAWYFNGEICNYSKSKSFGRKVSFRNICEYFIGSGQITATVDDIKFPVANPCISCGKEVPEGYGHVCPSCTRR